MSDSREELVATGLRWRRVHAGRASKRLMSNRAIGHGKQGPPNRTSPRGAMVTLPDRRRCPGTNKGREQGRGAKKHQRRSCRLGGGATGPGGSTGVASRPGRGARAHPGGDAPFLATRPPCTGHPCVEQLRGRGCHGSRVPARPGPALSPSPTPWITGRVRGVGRLCSHPAPGRTHIQRAGWGIGRLWHGFAFIGSFHYRQDYMSILRLRCGFMALTRNSRLSRFVYATGLGLCRNHPFAISPLPVPPRPMDVGFPSQSEETRGK